MIILPKSDSPAENVIMSLQESWRGSGTTLLDQFGVTEVEFTDRYAESTFLVGVGIAQPEDEPALSVYSAQRDLGEGLSHQDVADNMALGRYRHPMSYRLVTASDVDATATAIIEDWDDHRYGADNLEEVRDVFAGEVDVDLSDAMLLRLLVRSLQDSYASSGEVFPYTDSVPAPQSQRWDF